MAVSLIRTSFPKLKISSKQMFKIKPTSVSCSTLKLRSSWLVRNFKNNVSPDLVLTCDDGVKNSQCQLQHDLLVQPSFILNTCTRGSCIRNYTTWNNQLPTTCGSISESLKLSVKQTLNSKFSTSGDMVNEEEDAKKSKRVFGAHEFEFDENGYLSIDSVVKFLELEAAFDVCVIKTSGTKRSYVDYFLVVSGVSIRHIRAMSKNLEILFRGHEVRGVSKHGHVTVEGLESDSWLAVDIGNMVVHFFLPEMREIYELEKLWTLGPNYDDQYKEMLEKEEFLQAVFLGEQKQNPEEDGE